MHLNLINLCSVVSFSCSELETGGMLQGGKTVTVKDSSKEIASVFGLKIQNPIEKVYEKCKSKAESNICSCFFLLV